MSHEQKTMDDYFQSLPEQESFQQKKRNLRKKVSEFLKCAMGTVICSQAKTKEAADNFVEELNKFLQTVEKERESDKAVVNSTEDLASYWWQVAMLSNTKAHEMVTKLKDELPQFEDRSDKLITTLRKWLESDSFANVYDTGDPWSDRWKLGMDYTQGFDIVLGEEICGWYYCSSCDYYTNKDKVMCDGCDKLIVDIEDGLADNEDLAGIEDALADNED